MPYLVGTTDSEIPDATLEQLGPGGRGGLVAAAHRAGAPRPRRRTAATRSATSTSVPTCCSPSRRATSRWPTATTAPTYRYRFTIAPDTVVAADGGAPHTAELAFVFDDVRRQGTPVANAEALADQVADLWVDFATDGEPDGWPRAETGEVMVFTARRAGRRTRPVGGPARRGPGGLRAGPGRRRGLCVDLVDQVWGSGLGRILVRIVRSARTTA